MSAPHHPRKNKSWQPSDPSKTEKPLARQPQRRTIIMGRRWRWIGHVMRREPASSHSRQVNPHTRSRILEGKRKRGRPKNTLRRPVGGSSKPSITTGGPFRSWPRTNKSGSIFVATLHIPAGRTGTSECVRYKNVKYFNLVHAHNSKFGLVLSK